MLCIRCGAENPDDSLECRECGHKLQSRRKGGVSDDSWLFEEDIPKKSETDSFYIDKDLQIKSEEEKEEDEEEKEKKPEITVNFWRAAEVWFYALILVILGQFFWANDMIWQIFVLFGVICFVVWLRKI